MTLEHLLETFDPLKAKTSSKGTAVLDTAEIEKIRTEAYESGYSSGWDDARNSADDAHQRVEAEFERNIQNLAFTYNEAVDRIRAELKGFVAALIEGFFPELTPELLREHVRAELIRIADEHIEVPLELVTSPDCAALLRDMLQSDFTLKIELITDQNLAPHQVFIRIAEREIEVDLAPLLGALQEQFKAVHHPNEQKVANDA